MERYWGLGREKVAMNGHLKIILLNPIKYQNIWLLFRREMSIMVDNIFDGFGGRKWIQ